MSGGGDARRAGGVGWGAVVAPLVVLGLAFALRRWVVEPEALGFACRAGGPWWCPFRGALVATFSHGALGFASLAAGLLSFATRRAWVPALAAALGFAALVLYNYELGAVGLVLAALRLARLAAAAPQELGREHG
ncbi:MAG: hypothetical protein N2544_09085 [Burkholderiales bacterium]|nr:hypothetical protein [Burkholderiales bacterium]